MDRNKPWLTTYAIEFIETYLQLVPQPKILEFGIGASTVWFSNNYQGELIGVEHNKKWYDEVQKLVKPHVQLILRESAEVEPESDLLCESYAEIADQFPDDYFDLILVDGRNRIECFNKAEPKLKSKGLMVLDNSERAEYAPIFKAYSEKECYTFIQHGPDEFGFCYEGWSTTVWKK